MATRLGESEIRPGNERVPRAPRDLERSRRVRSTGRYCDECGGPWGRELRGGPVVHHFHGCAVVD